MFRSLSTGAFEPILQAGHRSNSRTGSEPVGRLTLGRSFDDADSWDSSCPSSCLDLKSFYLAAGSSGSVRHRRPSGCVIPSPEGFESSKRRGASESTVQAANGVIAGTAIVDEFTAMCARATVVILHASMSEVSRRSTRVNWGRLTWVAPGHFCRGWPCSTLCLRPSAKKRLVPD